VKIDDIPILSLSVSFLTQKANLDVIFPVYEHTILKKPVF